MRNESWDQACHPDAEEKIFFKAKPGSRMLEQQ
jgi:hypothetical protein